MTRYFPFIIALLFLCCAYFFLPFRHVFEYDPDEGVNLIKAALYKDGYSLYQQIWSDQPPLFTYLVAAWMTLFGESVAGVRLLTLLFSALLIASLIGLISKRPSALSALTIPLLLLLSDQYLRLSAAVMIGLPSLSLAIASLWLLKNTQPRLIFSALSMAFAVQIKFSALICLIPAFAMLSLRRSLLIWLSVFLAAFLCIACIFHEWDLSQVLQPHLSAAHLPTAISRPSQTFQKMLLADYEIGLLAFFSLCLPVREKKRYLPPLLWAILALFILSRHSPLWAHHYLLLAVPLCWLAGLGLADLPMTFKHAFLNTSSLASKIFRLTPPMFLLGALAIFLSSLPTKFERMRKQTYGSFPQPYHALIDTLASSREKTQWLVTDRPIFAFYAGLRVPPGIAVASRKRIVTGNLTSDDVLAMIHDYAPNFLLFNRHSLFLDDVPDKLDKSAYHLVCDENYAHPTKPGDFLHIKLFLQDAKAL